MRTEEQAEEWYRELIRTGKEARQEVLLLGFLTCGKVWSYFAFYLYEFLDNILACFLTEQNDTVSLTVAQWARTFQFPHSQGR